MTSEGSAAWWTSGPPFSRPGWCVRSWRRTAPRLTLMNSVSDRLTKCTKMTQNEHFNIQTVFLVPINSSSLLRTFWKNTGFSRLGHNGNIWTMVKFFFFYSRKYVFAGIWSPQGPARVWSLHLHKVWITVCSVPAWTCQSKIPVIPAASLLKLLHNVGGVTRGSVGGSGGGCEGKSAGGTAGLISWNLSLSDQDGGRSKGHYGSSLHRGNNNLIISSKNSKSAAFRTCLWACRESICFGGNENRGVKWLKTSCTPTFCTKDQIFRKSLHSESMRGRHDRFRWVPLFNNNLATVGNRKVNGGCVGPKPLWSRLPLPEIIKYWTTHTVQPKQTAASCFSSTPRRLFLPSHFSFCFPSQKRPLYVLSATASNVKVSWIAMGIGRKFEPNTWVGRAVPECFTTRFSLCLCTFVSIPVFSEIKVFSNRISFNCLIQWHVSPPWDQEIKFTIIAITHNYCCWII